jgi:hypothetical protein
MRMRNKNLVMKIVTVFNHLGNFSLPTHSSSYFWFQGYFHFQESCPKKGKLKPHIGYWYVPENAYTECFTCIFGTINTKIVSNKFDFDDIMISSAT